MQHSCIPEKFFKGDILHNAASIIIAHNHPSGDPTPSAEDVEITERLIKSGDLLGQVTSPKTMVHDLQIIFRHGLF